MTENTHNEAIQQDHPEIWKAVPGYEAIYQVSNLGRFRSMIQRMGTQVGDILKGSESAAGYHQIRLTDIFGRKKRYSSHRLVLHTFNPVEGCEKLDVNHKNGLKGDNRIENLEWATRSENILHAIHVLKTRVVLRGEDASNAKLTDNQVRAIRRAWNNGRYISDLAALCNVSQYSIHRIVHRKSWAHID